MIIATRPFTAGDKRRYTVSYDQFLAAGDFITLATVTCTDLTVTISGVDYITNARAVTFFVHGGTAHTPFTVTVSITDTLTQVVTDTIEFDPVVNPNGS